jgi:hypothetical protein
MPRFCRIGSLKYSFLFLFLFALNISLLAKSFKVLEENQDYLIVQFSLPEYKINKTEISGKTYHRIYAPNSSSYNEKGKPVLPYFSQIVGIPSDGDISWEILDQTKTRKSNLMIIPAYKPVPNGETLDYEFFLDKDFYNSNQTFPAKTILKGKKSFLRDRALISFILNPFQYNAKSHSLEIITSLKVKIYIHGTKENSRFWRNSNNFIDKAGDKFFINNTTSKKWRVARKPAESYPERNNDIITAIKLVVDSDGIYKITRDDLQTAVDEYLEEHEIEIESAFDWDSIDPRYLELYDEEGSVPIRFVGENDGSFDADDYFEFYGEQHHGETSYYDDYTNENTYQLKIIDHIASRMAVENGGIQNSDPTNYTVPKSFEQTVHFEEQNNFSKLGYQFSLNQNYYREDLWFWDKIDAPNLKIFPIDLQYPYDSNLRKFNAKIVLFGLTYIRDNPNQVNHSAIVRLNSSLIGSKMWAGQKEVTIENDLLLANSQLHNGINELYVSLPGVEGIEVEQVLLDYIEINYWREYKTDNDYIKFTKPSNKPLGLYQFEIDNFSENNISVYKIGSSYFENPQITSFTADGLPPFKVTFQDSIIAPDYEYIAVTENMKKTPKTIIPDLPSNLKSPDNSAQYIIITTSDFAKNEGTLMFKELREAEGIPTKIVSIEDIFDEFNFGIRSIESIKDFISYAYNNWAEPQVTHILLLGDGLNDEKDDSPDRMYNLVPFKRIWTSDGGAIASDNWIGCIVGDDMIPDVSISRISVWDEDQILPIAEKSQHYLENPNYNDMWHGSVTMAAGGNPDEGTFFALQSERIREQFIPSEYKINRVYCNVDNLPAEYAGNTTSLIQTINNGTIFLQFMGHGGGHVWADYNLLNISDIHTFNNENFPFVSSFACYGSAFNYRQSSCIGEELTLLGDKGAIAHFGFTGYGYAEADENIAGYMNQALFDLKLGNIGYITDYAKARFYADNPYSSTNYALVQCGVLLGDHMANIISPDVIDNIEIADSHLEPGEILQASTAVDDDIFMGKYVIYDENDAQLSLNSYFPISTVAIDGVISTNVNTQYQIPSDSDASLNTIKLFAYGAEREIIGKADFTVGTANVQNISISPENPTAQDSVVIYADFITDEDIESILLITYILDEDDNSEIPIASYNMELIDGISYKTIDEIDYHNSSIVRYYFVINYTNDESDETLRYNYLIQMPDIYFQHYEISANNNYPAFKTFIGNIGQQDSPVTYLRLYRYNNDISNYSLIDSLQINTLAPYESKWFDIPLPLYTESVRFKATLNENRLFAEPNYYANNTLYTSNLDFNLFEAGLIETEITSQDSNLVITFPNNLLNEPSVFSLENYGNLEPINQPDISKILLADSLQQSVAYNINCLNHEILADTLGHFADGKMINLKFYYCQDDSLTQLQENSDNFRIYRWEDNFEKWISLGGNISMEDDFVTVNVNRIGTYALFQNNDISAPYVEANVEGQEFTYGGYVAHNGIISIVLSDANGIDLFDNKVQLFLNADSTPLNENNYNITARKGNLTHIPIKYQLDLPEGEHYLTVDCTDVNGNLTSHEIQFTVNTQFDLINVANYPNPVKSQAENPINEGRTRFTYVLTDDADSIELKIYTVSGRLVKTFDELSPSIGYHEYPRTLYGWDCRDDKGYPLANGVYFYKLTAKKGNKKITKTMKMAILK